jgi:hypothetical protein
MASFDFDAFISHASEDKAVFVTPLANALKKYGLKVWFDKFTLKVGDDLHESIEKGLARSRYGVVVFSPKFLAKNWPKEELSGLFTRQVDGNKVILPVWHKVSSTKMKSIYPMLAGKYALRSSDGIEAVARSLIETIRPELLELDVRQESAFEAGDSFVAEARRKHPGYDFAVKSGPFAEDLSPATRFAMNKGKHRVEISVSDPSAIESPPGGTIQFFGEGVRKAIEFEQTGKSQKWEAGEFALASCNVPLMPSTVKVGTLVIGERKPSIILSRHIRVEVGSTPDVIFPLMEMRPVRMGTQESEVILSDKESPLTIHIVFPLGSNLHLDCSREADMKFSWNPAGKSASECKKLIEAVDSLQNGSALRIIDIRLDRLLFELTARASGFSDLFTDNFRRTVLLASQIEQKFFVTLRMPDVISEEDDESLFHLDCLLNGREYGRAANTTLRLVKANGETGAVQEAFIRDECSATLTDSPSDFPGFFPLFGQRVVTPHWIRVMEFTAAGGQANVKAFSDAPLGSEFPIAVTAKGPTSLRWKDE